jgi:hypothetical protein
MQNAPQRKDGGCVRDAPDRINRNRFRNREDDDNENRGSGGALQQIEMHLRKRDPSYPQ